VIAKMAEHFQDLEVDFRIITPYDAQRGLIELTLKNNGLNWQDKVCIHFLLSMTFADIGKS
jgi:superfamily I DNA and/or RNA helicase